MTLYKGEEKPTIVSGTSLDTKVTDGTVLARQMS